MEVTGTANSLQLTVPFGISRGTKQSADTIVVAITANGQTGYGEAVPYARYRENPASSLKDIESLPGSFDRNSLLELLPAGAARNAADAALWDLEAKTSGKPVWQLAGLTDPKPLPMGYTVSLKSTPEMISDAEKHSGVRLIKIKLGGTDDANALRGIRKAAPEARLIVDANEGWSITQFSQIVETLVEARVELVEQPVESKFDNELADVQCPIPLCADESFQPGADPGDLADAYGFVNIKLDKSGGLTKALADLASARQLGLGVMVGCMVGSSLSIAPAFLLAQLADYSDLDGFFSIAEDHEHPMTLEAGFVTAPQKLWGYPN